MPEPIKLFFIKDIVTFGTYSVTILDIIIIVPLIIATLMLMRVYNRLVKKKKLLGKGYIKTISRVIKAILLFLVFIGVMWVLGVKLNNMFDFIGAVLTFKIFSIGDTDVSLLTIIVMAVVIYISTKLAVLVRNYFNNRVFPQFNIDVGLKFSLSKLIGYSIIAIGIIIALQGLGIRLAALTVFAGVLGVGIGFGMQNITANIVSGIVILFERPIKEGDMVRLQNTIGEVKKINLRATIIRTIYNEHLIVPNSAFINSTVENMSYGDLKLRISVKVGVSYGSDPHHVRDILLEAARATEHVMEHPEPNVLFKQFGDSSLDFELFAWVDNPAKRFETESDLHFNIVKKFSEEGITIPFPQRDVYLKQMPQS